MPLTWLVLDLLRKFSDGRDVGLGNFEHSRHHSGKYERYSRDRYSRRSSR